MRNYKNHNIVLRFNPDGDIVDFLFDDISMSPLDGYHYENTCDDYGTNAETVLTIRLTNSGSITFRNIPITVQVCGKIPDDDE